MITGFNKIVDDDGFVQWWKAPIQGDDLLAQDHKGRSETKQGSYPVDLEYGNPLANTIPQNLPFRELNMRIIAETREMSLQDGRFKECIVDAQSIEILEGNQLHFNYQLVKQDGTTIDREFG